MSNLAEQLKRIVRADPYFMSLLRAARKVNPPEWALGGGVIRSLVWDHLHGHAERTEPPDVDVVFFDPTLLEPANEELVTQQLTQALPGVPWQARNQAHVHLWYPSVFGVHADPFSSIEEAVGTWPEPCTAVAITLDTRDELSIISPLGLADLFEMIVRHNPARATREHYEDRVRTKFTPERWPLIRVVDL